MATLAQLKQLYGADLSDDEVIGAASKEFGLPATDIAAEVGYKTGGKWSNRAGAAVDAAQSQLLGAGADLAETAGLPGAAEWANKRQKSNAAQANVQRQMAQEQGAVMDWRDVSGIGSGLEYAGGLLVDTAPQMAASIGGSVAGGIAGTAVAGPAGTVAGAMTGAALAGAPFNYGDIRENMIEQTGRVDKAAALGLTVPYTALDAFGVEGLLARTAGKALAKDVTKELGEQVAKQGSVNLLDRGLKVGGVALGEGAAETGQEVVNQYGRQVVDPNVDMMSEDAKKRYLDSFIGGAVMGGSVGTLHQAGSMVLGDKADPVEPSKTEVPLAVPGSAAAATTPPTTGAPTREVGGEAVLPPQVEDAAKMAMPMGASPMGQGAATPEEQARQEQLAAIEERTAQIKAIQDEAVNVHKLASKPAVEGFIALQEALDAGTITPEEMAEGVAQLKAGRLQVPKTMLREKQKAAQTLAQQQAKAAVEVPAAAAGEVAKTEAKEAEVAAKEQAAAAQKPTETTAPTQAAAPPADAVARQTGEVSPGLRAVSAVKDSKGKPLSDQARDRLLLIAGLDREGWAVSNPRTLEEVAVIENDRLKALGKPPVSRQAIQGQLKKYGITDAVIKSLHDIASSGAEAASTSTVAGAIEGTEATAEDRTPQTSEGPDITELGEQLGASESKTMRVIDSPESQGIVEDKDRATQDKESLRALAKSKEYSDEQRKAFSAVAGIKNDKAREGGIRALVANKKGIFTPEQQKVLAEMFQSDEQRSVAQRKQKEVEIQREADKAPDAELVKANEAAIAAAEAERAEYEEAERQINARTLKERLPADLHNEIADAQDAFDVELEEGDPTWHDLTPAMQERWVRMYASQFDTPAVLEGGNQAPYLRVHEEIRDESIQRRNRSQAAEQGRGGDADQAAEDARRGAGQAGQAVSGAGGGSQAAAPGQPEPELAEVQGGAGEDGQGADLENIEFDPEPLLATPPASAPQDGGQRAPSVKRALRTLLTQLEAGDLTPEAFANRVEIELRLADRGRERTVDRALAQGRARGADYIRERLLEARRRGDLDADAVEMADWFIRQNPALVENLGVSVRAPGKGDRAVSGSYNPASRVMRLIKGSDNFETAVHEILHHLERMMPADMQNAIRRAWMMSTARARQAAFEGDNKDLQAYYRALLNYHWGDGSDAHRREAEKLLKDGKVPYAHYQHFNPSEFWAVNGSRIVSGRFMASDSMVARIKQYIRDFVEKVKAMLGAQSDAAVIRALDSMANADGQFVSGAMLQDQPGVHFMYGGRNAASQEQEQLLRDAEVMTEGGFSPDVVRQATGWFKGAHDKKWRFEFSDHDAYMLMEPDQMADSPMFFGTPTYYRLADVIDHPELFAKYPEAAEIQVIKQTAEYGVQGWYGPQGIGITPRTKNPLSTILHEVQHWVQEKEGFAAGGNSATVMEKMNDAQRERFIQEVADEMDKPLVREREELRTMRDTMRYPQVENMRLLRTRQRELNRLMGEWRKANPGVPLDDPEYAVLAKSAADSYSGFTKLRDDFSQQQWGIPWHRTTPGQSAGIEAVVSAKSIEDATANLLGRAQALQDNLATVERVRSGDPDAVKAAAKNSMAAGRAYRRLAGEIEARDTQARQDMTPATRRDQPPLSSEPDILPEDVVITYKASGPQASVEQRMENIERTANTTAQAMPPRVAAAQRMSGKMMSHAAGTLKRTLSFTEDLVRQAAKALPSAQKYLDQMRASTVARLRREREVDRIVERFKPLTHSERAATNKYLYNSTLSKKWGYQPTFHDKVEIDPAMAAQFNALSERSKAVVQDVFKHGFDTLNAMKEAVRTNVATEYDAIIAAHEAAGDKDKAAAERTKRDAALENFGSLMNIDSTWPYTPLKRFGNVVVVGKSQAYIDAENAGDTKLMNQLKTNENHYRVEFRENRMQAYKLQEQLAAQFGDNIDVFEKDSAYSKIGGQYMFQSFQRLRNMAEDVNEDNLGSKANKALGRLMSDLYLTMLSENSARQSERQREGIAGADQDMMRAFATKGRADANFIAAMENTAKTQDALQAMKKEADRTGTHGGVSREKRRDYYNEIVERHVMNMDWQPSPTIDKMLTASSFWTILMSPASMLTNLSQPLVMSLPSIAGRHGYLKSLTAMMRAYKDFGPRAAWKGFDDQQLEALPADVREQVRELINRGRIDITLEQDLGNWRSDGQKNAVQTVAQKFRDISGAIEKLNRVATAITALRLEKARDPNTDGVAYAERVIYDTHGDYSAMNAPRFMRTGVGRLVTQFRKFQLIQISMYAKLYHDAFKGESKEVRQVGKRALAFNLITMFGVGGTLGMPGAQMIGWMLRQVFGDDDEPDNPELTLRKLIDDEDLADLLLKGVPARMGLDLSGRLGASYMLSLLPYAKTDLSRKSTTENLVQLMGPFVGGVVPRVADGISKVGEGDYMKGVEQMLPKGLGDAIKGWRIATQGITQTNGDTVLGADDIGTLEAFSQAIGLPTTKISDRQWRANVKYESDTFYRERTNDVKQQYSRAYRAGDTEAMAQARDEWTRVQAARRAAGYQPKPLSDLLKAPREQGKRERITIGGVQGRRGDQGMLRQLEELN